MGKLSLENREVDLRRKPAAEGGSITIMLILRLRAVRSKK